MFNKSWVAYCTHCQEEIYTANNSNMVQASAEVHREKTGHMVLVGLYVGSAKSEKNRLVPMPCNRKAQAKFFNE